MDREEKITLYDIYGQLLSDKQRRYFEWYYFEDLSLAEIAENAAVSRQAIQVMLESAVKKMVHYESVLGIAKKQTKKNKLIDIIASAENRDVIDLSEVLSTLKEL